MAGKLARWMGYCAAAVIVAMCLHISVAVVCRVVFRVSLPATIEIVSYYYMVIVTFLPLALAQVLNEHVSVDILFEICPEWLKPWLQRFADLLTMLVIGVFCAAMVRSAIRQTASSEYSRTGLFDLPIWPARWIVPLGLAAMLLVLIAQLTNALSHKAGPSIGDDTGMDG